MPHILVAGHETAARGDRTEMCFYANARKQSGSGPFALVSRAPCELGGRVH